MIPLQVPVLSAARDFETEAVFLEHILKTVTSADKNSELIYSEVNAVLGQTAWKCLKDNAERRNVRKQYNSLTSTLRVRIMPTGLTTVTSLSPFTAGHTMALLRNRTYASKPTTKHFIVNCLRIRLSESTGKLQSDLGLWLKESNGAVRAVIILNWRTNAAGNVLGDIEMYVPDRNRMPALVQRETVFPEPAALIARAQALNLNRGQIFERNVFQGRNPADILKLPLDTLREKARDASMHMGLSEA
ncbi:hypothetical protein BDW69DRAFT_188356 [Aspergillus filifer]